MLGALLERARSLTGAPKLALASLGGVVLLASISALVLAIAAPSVDASCARLEGFARAAGESPGAAERETCRARLEAARDRGLLRGVGLSWCLRLAQSIPEAGECLGDWR
ncbi:hypothetical protein G6O69_25925 [Pseudenhygromyxa sp. WMMC2535]|uniref:hypothetical protein n=1 Tax=Pseudenhygromyxa sp. WMMC2535 TaxID=2712867 RepID=UPI001551804D|nr:hypothetical protein [Pseudenhygromyxa sp. WMMC2535]NVB41303.1 hypothetical protein [Pseudenhygromyxa sp. WMMC2535]